jgi:hypothetical protein
MKTSFVLLIITVLLTGCGSLKPSLSVSSDRVQRLALTGAQKTVVVRGVGEMVAMETAIGGETASLRQIEAFRLDGNPDIQVCGNVRYEPEPGKSSRLSTYYLEITDKNGTPEAKRGQVGFDERKAAKV